jgi:branched-subunit amino acid transport protein
MMVRKWLRYLAAFLMSAGFVHHLAVQRVVHNAWSWSFAIATLVATVIGIGNVAVNLYIRHARSIFE